MIDLCHAATNQLIGSITEADLKVLVDGLEEESSQDQDYYIDLATIDLLADGRATFHLVGLLRSAVGSSELTIAFSHGSRCRSHAFAPAPADRARGWMNPGAADSMALGLTAKCAPDLAPINMMVGG